MDAPPNSDRVDPTNPNDVETWTRSLGISRDELEQAVAAAGPEVGAVYDYIQRARQTRPQGDGTGGK